MLRRKSSRFIKQPIQPESLINNSDYKSTITVIQKGKKETRSRSQSHINLWLAKSNDQEAGVDRCFEVYSAWCHQLYLSNPTQPKHYILEGEASQPEKVAVKYITDFTCSREELREKHGDLLTDAKIKAYFEKMLAHGNNMELFFQTLIEFLREGDADLKWDHIGTDKNGSLVRIDFGQAFAPLRYKKPKNYCFDLTTNDLQNLPFLTDYRTQTYLFNKRGTLDTHSWFSDLRKHSNFQAMLHRALLKRLLMPRFMEYVALDIFEAEPTAKKNLVEFQQRRDLELLKAALKWPEFTQAISKNTDSWLGHIVSDLTSNHILQLKYFRNQQDHYKEKIRISITANLALLKYASNASTHDLAITITMALHYIERQIFRLEEKLPTFRNRGIEDKLRLYRNLHENFHKQLLTCNKSSFINQVAPNLLKSTAIISHHKRYSKTNAIFTLFNWQSTSWTQFKEFIKEAPGSEQKRLEDLTNKKSRRTIDEKDGKINSYNSYRRTRALL